MARPDQPRRRFAPEPIETTFTSSSSKKGNGPKNNGQSSRQQPRIGPNPELTPEPSPRSPSPIPADLLRPRRRFAPQLIETSRRSRRVGDKGPATKPTDKTDITPYTRNIYTATKHRGRRRGDDETMHAGPMPPTRRETEDEGVKEYLLELAAKEAERQMQQVALLAFPNSQPREGGVDHFYFRESSESDNSYEAPSPDEGLGHNKARRQSSELGMNWWHQHMREHAENLTHDEDLVPPKPTEAAAETEDHDRMDIDEPESVPAPVPGHDDSAAAADQGPAKALPQDSVMRTDSDLDKMDLTAPPDPMWTTTNKQVSPADRRDSTPGARGPIGESLMPLIQTDPYVTGHTKDKAAQPAAAPSRPIGESPMPFLPPSAPSGKPADVPYANPSQIPPDTGFRNQGGPFGRPFGGFGYKSPAGPRFQPRQKFVSPPMLGKDLKFRRCPSPKQTKLEPDHLFARQHAEEKNRDLSGRGGLWRGYCYKSESNDGYLVPAELQAPPLMLTPMPPATPGEMDTSGYASMVMSDEPSTSLSPTDSALSLGSLSPSTAEHRPRNGKAKGLRMLHGIDERLQKEKALAELDEKIAQEFDDAFVTQVYNYLSLGYPATARAFDEELSRISRISIDELERDDEKYLSKGHLTEADDKTPREKRGPRWKALRVYINEWARQHPDLDNLEPAGWGVRERRGSWAI